MTTYLTVKRFAEERCLSQWTVYRMVERDEIDYERFGRAIRIVVGTGAGDLEFERWKKDRWSLNQNSRGRATNQALEMSSGKGLWV